MGIGGRLALLDALQDVATEVQHDVFVRDVATTVVGKADVVPAVAVERVLQLRGTEQEDHLLATHPWTQLGYLFVVDDVALDDLRFVEGAATDSEQDAESGNETYFLPAFHVEYPSAGCRDWVVMVAQSRSDGNRHGGNCVSNKELKQAGLKATLPRLKILQLLEANPDRHMSAEDVYRSLIEAGEDVGIATIYRVLTQFEGAGLVVRHNFDSGHAVFELNQGEHHDHLVCTRCGKVTEFVDAEIERRQREIAKRAGYQITDHSLYIYGLCADCQACPAD